MPSDRSNISRSAFFMKGSKLEKFQVRNSYELNLIGYLKDIPVLSAERNASISEKDKDAHKVDIFQMSMTLNQKLNPPMTPKILEKAKKAKKPKGVIRDVKTSSKGGDKVGLDMFVQYTVYKKKKTSMFYIPEPLLDHDYTHPPFPSLVRNRFNEGAGSSKMKEAYNELRRDKINKNVDRINKNVDKINKNVDKINKNVKMEEGAPEKQIETETPQEEPEINKLAPQRQLILFKINKEDIQMHNKNVAVSKGGLEKYSLYRIDKKALQTRNRTIKISKEIEAPIDGPRMVEEVSENSEKSHRKLRIVRINSAIPDREQELQPSTKKMKMNETQEEAPKIIQEDQEKIEASEIIEEAQKIKGTPERKEENTVKIEKALKRLEEEEKLKKITGNAPYKKNKVESKKELQENDEAPKEGPRKRTRRSYKKLIKEMAKETEETITKTPILESEVNGIIEEVVETTEQSKKVLQTPGNNLKTKIGLLKSLVVEIEPLPDHFRGSSCRTYRRKQNLSQKNLLPDGGKTQITERFEDVANKNPYESTSYLSQDDVELQIKAHRVEAEIKSIQTRVQTEIKLKKADMDVKSIPVATEVESNRGIKSVQIETDPIETELKLVKTSRVYKNATSGRVETEIKFKEADAVVVETEVESSRGIKSVQVQADPIETESKPKLVKSSRVSKNAISGRVETEIKLKEADVDVKSVAVETEVESNRGINSEQVQTDPIATEPKPKLVKSSRVSKNATSGRVETEIQPKKVGVATENKSSPTQMRIKSVRVESIATDRIETESKPKPVNSDRVETEIKPKEVSGVIKSNRVATEIKLNRVQMGIKSCPVQNITTDRIETESKPKLVNSDRVETEVQSNQMGTKAAQVENSTSDRTETEFKSKVVNSDRVETEIKPKEVDVDIKSNLDATEIKSNQVQMGIKVARIQTTTDQIKTEVKPKEVGMDTKSNSVATEMQSNRVQMEIKSARVQNITSDQIKTESKPKLVKSTRVQKKVTSGRVETEIPPTEVGIDIESNLLATEIKSNRAQMGIISLRVLNIITDGTKTEAKPNVVNSDRVETEVKPKEVPMDVKSKRVASEIKSNCPQLIIRSDLLSKEIKSNQVATDIKADRTVTRKSKQVQVNIKSETKVKSKQVQTETKPKQVDRVQTQIKPVEMDFKCNRAETREMQTQTDEVPVVEVKKSETFCQTEWYSQDGFAQTDPPVDDLFNTDLEILRLLDSLPDDDIMPIGRANLIDAFSPQNSTFHDLTPKAPSTSTFCANVEEVDPVKMQLYREMRASTQFNASGNMPIHSAVLDNQLKAVERQCIVLQIMNQTINFQNSNHLTPLQLAILEEAHRDIIITLLRNGADISAIDEVGNNVIHLAVMSNRGDILQILLSPNVGNPKYNINGLNFEGFTALMFCCMQNLFNLAEILLKHQADPNIQDQKSGRTALFHAIENNYVQIVKLLLDNGADKKVRNFFGTTPHDAIFELDGIDSEVKALMIGKDPLFKKPSVEKGKRKAGEAGPSSKRKKRGSDVDQ